MKGAWRIGLAGKAIIGLAVPLLLSGCGGPGVDVAPVKGKVTVAGQPMADIVVTFQTSGRPATGRTDASGNFTLTTFSDGDGAVPGTHKVSFAHVPPSATPLDSSAPPTEPTLPFNVKYNNAETSGITADVVSGKTNEVGPWDLEK